MPRGDGYKAHPPTPMRVLKAFDHWQAGDTMPQTAVDDQKQRGNLADLIRNGFLEGKSIQGEILPDYAAMSDSGLKALAKERGIKSYWLMNRDTLIEKLTDGDS